MCTTHMQKHMHTWKMGKEKIMTYNDFQVCFYNTLEPWWLHFVEYRCHVSFQKSVSLWKTWHMNIYFLHKASIKHSTFCKWINEQMNRVWMLLLWSMTLLLQDVHSTLICLETGHWDQTIRLRHLTQHSFLPQPLPVWVLLFPLFCCVFR